MPGFSFRPWESVRLPQVITALALATGLPLFLRTPVWCDITLYEVAARTLLRGGVHYRDVFDTNLPGFVWLLTVICWAFGFSSIALRCVDLAIVAGVVYLIDRLARRGGATPVSRWWAIAAAAVLYPSTVEMVHAQRDTWMALPAVAALLIRVRRGSTSAPSPAPGFAWACLEGALWGCAVWIKPHCILMAAGVWLATAWPLARATTHRRSTLLADALGNLTGGLVVGLAGLALVVAGGSWSGFWEVLTVWAPEYADVSRRELEMRYDLELHWFPPWSLLLIPTVPLAMLSIVDAAPWAGLPSPEPSRPGPVGRLLPGWLWDREAGSQGRIVRAALAVLYLVWSAQSFYIQRGFVYCHMVELFLMFGLWAAHRWSLPAAVILWIALTSTFWLIGDRNPRVRARLFTIARHDGRPASEPEYEHYFVRHPLADWQRLKLWSRCWRCSLSNRERYILWDQLRRLDGHEAAFSWEELDEVAEFLRSKHVGDRELIAWHDTPHALYLMLNIEPGLRYMHVNTAQGISDAAHARVQVELAATAGVARYAVSDLEYPAIFFSPEKRRLLLGPLTNDQTLLPVALDEESRTKFPFNQRAIYRTRGGRGRYIVHELTPPLGDSPPPDRLKSRLP